MDLDAHAEFAELVHDAAVEFHNRLRFERDLRCFAAAGPQAEHMGDEVEFQFEVFIADRNGRGGQPACRHIERYLPAMVHPGRAREPDLAGDLHPELQRRGGVAPRRVGQIGPVGAIRHGDEFEGGDYSRTWVRSVSVSSTTKRES